MIQAEHLFPLSYDQNPNGKCIKLQPNLPNFQFKYRWFFVWECCENISWFSMTRFVWALWHSFHFQLFFYYEFVTFWCQLNFKILLKTKLHIIETFFCPYIKLIESNFHNFGFFKEKSVTSVWQHWRKHGSLRKS